MSISFDFGAIIIFLFGLIATVLTLTTELSIFMVHTAVRLKTVARLLIFVT